MALETEAKIKVGSLDDIRAKLDAYGAANEGDCLERNWVLDNRDGELKKKGVLLRVRNEGEEGGILTIKRPVEGGEFKTREEIETMVDSAEELIRQLTAVGFEVKWVYEKHRQTWLWRDCVLALDECPELGFFIEIEGVPDKIREVAGELGLNPADHIDDNYLGLWMKHLEKLGQKPRNMLFDHDTAARRRKIASRTTQIRRKGL